jgi:mannose-6-phosphate isomerase-like protein (cupin superfamily)
MKSYKTDNFQRNLGAYVNIEKITLKNSYYRRVLYTNSKQQLVVMSLLPGEEIGMEKHPKTSQFIRVEAGKGIAIIGGKRKKLSDGDIVMINPGVLHNIINTSRTKKLKLYTLYSPPEHRKGLKQRVKPDFEEE